MKTIAQTICVLTCFAMIPILSPSVAHARQKKPNRRIANDRFQVVCAARLGSDSEPQTLAADFSMIPTAQNTDGDNHYFGSQTLLSRDGVLVTVSLSEEKGALLVTIGADLDDLKIRSVGTSDFARLRYISKKRAHNISVACGIQP